MTSYSRSNGRLFLADFEIIGEKSEKNKEQEERPTIPYQNQTILLVAFLRERVINNDNLSVLGVLLAYRELLITIDGNFLDLILMIEEAKFEVLVPFNRNVFEARVLKLLFCFIVVVLGHVLAGKRNLNLDGLLRRLLSLSRLFILCCLNRIPRVDNHKHHTDNQCDDEQLVIGGLLNYLTFNLLLALYGFGRWNSWILRHCIFLLLLRLELTGYSIPNIQRLVSKRVMIKGIHRFLDISVFFA